MTASRAAALLTADDLGLGHVFGHGEPQITASDRIQLHTVAIYNHTKIGAAKAFTQVTAPVSALEESGAAGTRTQDRRIMRPAR